MAMTTRMASRPTDRPDAAAPVASTLEAHWEALQQKLDAHRHLFCRAGGLFTKRAWNRYFVVLRFIDKVDSKRVLRTIYIGRAEDEELIRRTESYLDECRVLARIPEEMAELVAMMGVIRGLGSYVERQDRRARRAASDGGARPTSG